MTTGPDQHTPEASVPQDDAGDGALARLHALGSGGGVGPDEFSRPGALRAWSLSTSLAVHVGLAALTMLWISRTPGLIKDMSAAISVEMLATEFTEQHTVEEISEIVEVPAEAARAADPSPLDAVEVVEPQPLARDAQAEATPSPDLQEGMQAIQGAETTDHAIGAERKPERQAKEHEPARQRSPAKPRTSGAAEADSTGAKAKAPRVSASTGSVLNYASRVRAKVSAHLPRGGAGKGTVSVAFGVTPSGGLSYARIAKSSGNPAIDRAVMAGVRASAPFPPPPAGASSSQLRFSVSFQFH